MRFPKHNAKPKILIIDDDPSALELFQILLTPNYYVLTASSGQEGLRLIKQSSPDLILLDLLMPGMDGWQVCGEIRKFSEIPIIIISVIDSSEVISNILNLGADVFMNKPVSSSRLIAHINTLIRRASTEKLAQTHKSLN